MIERSLDPPEDVILAYCPVCGGEIYDGEVYWGYEGQMLCEYHLDDETAKVFGCMKMDGREQ